MDVDIENSSLNFGKTQSKRNTQLENQIL